MIHAISDNIISPLGYSSEENFRSVSSGVSALHKVYEYPGLKEECYISTIDNDLLNQRFADTCGYSKGLSKLEKGAILSATYAIAGLNIDTASPRVRFILSTTKGNVDILEPLWKSGERIAAHFKNPNPVLIISNACISGVCAQLAAKRELEASRCDYAVVIGTDILCPFIISGFQSFKALSPVQCAPFDLNRQGLNLGEAAATIVFERKEECSTGDAILVKCAIRNDANHISGPSRTGEGSYLALQEVLKGFDRSDISFINAHGTATMYNDEMESIAISRSGLSDIPINSMKGYFGHTLGAAGVVESIISLMALKHETVLGTAGFTQLGVSQPINISSDNRRSDKKAFIKLISGFGGCNAAILYKII